MYPKKNSLRALIFLIVGGYCAETSKNVCAAEAQGEPSVKEQMAGYAKLSLFTSNVPQKKIVPRIENIVIQSKADDDSPLFIERKGILTRYTNAQATVVICHGFMCDKYDVGFLQHLFAKGQFNTLVFDFRAHGEGTKGQVSTLGKYEAYDVIAAVQYIKSDPSLKDKPVFAYGFSMGAVSAIEAQAKVEGRNDGSILFDAMVLDCPFASTEKIIKRGLDSLKISLFGQEFSWPGKQVLAKYAFSPYVQGLVKYLLKPVVHVEDKSIETFIYPLYPVESVKKITVPCFFIHCKNDQRISVEDVRAVYAGARGFKRLWITNGRWHYDSFFYNPEEYKSHVRSFLRMVLNKEYVKESSELVIEDK